MIQYPVALKLTAMPYTPSQVRYAPILTLYSNIKFLFLAHSVARYQSIFKLYLCLLIFHHRFGHQQISHLQYHQQFFVVLHLDLTILKYLLNLS